MSELEKKMNETNRPQPPSLRAIFLKWLVVVPAVVALVVAVLVCLAGWMSDGTLGFWIEAEFFMPLPLYVLAYSFGAFVFMIPVGAVVALMLFRKHQKEKKTPNQAFEATP